MPSIMLIMMQKAQEKDAEEANASPETQPLQPYEQQRQDNIKRNARMLSQIQAGLQPTAQGFWQPLVKAPAQDDMSAGSIGTQHPDRVTHAAREGQAKQFNIADCAQKPAQSSPAEVECSKGAASTKELQPSPAQADGQTTTKRKNEDGSTPEADQSKQAGSGKQCPGEETSQTCKGAPGSEAAVAVPEDVAAVPEKKTQPPRHRKKQKQAHAPKQASGQGEDAKASPGIAGPAADQGANPDAPVASAVERMLVGSPDYSNAKSKAKRKSLKRARMETTHQPAKKPAKKQAQSPSKDRKKYAT